MKKIKKNDQLIKKLFQENKLLKQKIKSLEKKKMRYENNDIFKSILSDKNREILILSLCGIIIVILVHIITKSNN